MIRRISASLALLLTLVIVGQKDLSAQQQSGPLNPNEVHDLYATKGTETCLYNQSSYNAKVYVVLSRRSNKEGSYIIPAHGQICFNWNSKATVRIKNTGKVRVGFNNNYACEPGSNVC